MNMTNTSSLRGGGLWNPCKAAGGGMPSPTCQGLCIGSNAPMATTSCPEVIQNAFMLEYWLALGSVQTCSEHILPVPAWRSSLLTCHALETIRGGSGQLACSMSASAASSSWRRPAVASACTAASSAASLRRSK